MKLLLPLFFLLFFSSFLYAVEPSDSLRLSFIAKEVRKIGTIRADTLTDTLTIHYLNNSKQLLAIKCYFDSSQSAFKAYECQPPDFSLQALERANVLIITSDSHSLPFGRVIKFSILKINKPNFYEKNSAKVLAFYDSISVPALLRSPLGISLRMGYSRNQNVLFDGAGELPNNQFYQEISWSNKLLGLPFRLDYFNSNARADPEFSGADFRFSFDLPSWNKDLLDKEKLTNLKLNQLDEQIKQIASELRLTDSLRNNMEALVSDPGFEFDLNEQEQLLDRYKELDTLNEEQVAMRKSVESRLEILLQKKSGLDSLNRLQKAGEENLRKLQSEKDRVALEMENASTAGSGEFARFSSWRKSLRSSLKALEFGKSSPHFSELSLNAATLTGFNTEFGSAKWSLKLAGGLLDKRFNPWIPGSQQSLHSQLSFSGKNSLTYLNLSNRFSSPGEFFKGSPLIGLGTRQIVRTLSLEMEWAIPLKDSLGPFPQTSDLLKNAFQRSALKTHLNWQITSGLSSETQVAYWGLGFINPLINQPRRDLLRMEQSFKCALPHWKASFLVQLKHERNNLSGLSIASSRIWTGRLVIGKKFGRNWQLKGDFMQLRQELRSASQESYPDAKFINHLISLSVNRSAFNRRKAIRITNSLFATQNQLLSSNSGISLYQFSNSNSLAFEKQAIQLTNLNTYLRGDSDSSNSIQSSVNIQILKKYLTYGPGAGYIRKSADSDWLFLSLDLKFAFRKFNIALTNYFDRLRKKEKVVYLFRSDLQLNFQF